MCGWLSSLLSPFSYFGFFFFWVIERLNDFQDTLETEYYNLNQEEVASRRGLKVSTIITHLCEALKVGLSVDVRQLGVTEKLENLISRAIWAPPINGG